jgi:large subunit ribosomal protein L22
MEVKYAYVPQNETKAAKALGKDLNVSFKRTIAVCDAVRDMKLPDAIALLERVMALEEPIPFKKYNKGVSHRSGKGVAKFPKKAAGEVLKILRNAQSNAEYKGLDADKLRVISIQVNKGPSRKRRKPKGRWKAWKTQYVTVQAIVQERGKE